MHSVPHPAGSLRVNTLAGTTVDTPTSSKHTLSPFCLRRHADYQRVYKASRKHFSASMSYFFRLRKADEPNGPGNAPSIGPRVGLTVGKVMGKAVDRNRIKRRMREAVRLHLDLLLQAPATDPGASPLPIDLVLHPRKSVATMDFPALQRELVKVFTHVASAALTPQTPPPPRPDPRAAKGARVPAPIASPSSTAKPSRSGTKPSTKPSTKSGTKPDTKPGPAPESLPGPTPEPRP